MTIIFMTAYRGLTNHLLVPEPSTCAAGCVVPSFAIDERCRLYFSVSGPTGDLDFGRLSSIKGEPQTAENSTILQSPVNPDHRGRRGGHHSHEEHDASDHAHGCEQCIFDRIGISPCVMAALDVHERAGDHPTDETQRTDEDQPENLHHQQPELSTDAEFREFRQNRLGLCLRGGLFEDLFGWDLSSSLFPIDLRSRRLEKDVWHLCCGSWRLRTLSDGGGGFVELGCGFI